MPVPVHTMRTLALVAAVAVLGGCAAGGEDAAEDGKVDGALRLNPAGSALPIGTPGEIMVEGSTGRPVVVRTADDGTFAVTLAAGAYEVTGSSPRFRHGQGVCRPSTPVVVKAGAVTEIDVLCPRRSPPLPPVVRRPGQTPIIDSGA